MVCCVASLLYVYSVVDNRDCHRAGRNIIIHNRRQCCAGRCIAVRTRSVSVCVLQKWLRFHSIRPKCFISQRSGAYIPFQKHRGRKNQQVYFFVTLFYTISTRHSFFINLKYSCTPLASSVVWLYFPLSSKAEFVILWGNEIESTNNVSLVL